MITRNTGNPPPKKGQVTSAVAPTIRTSAVGILSAVILALPATASGQANAPAQVSDPGVNTQSNVVKRFVDIRCRLQSRCADIDRGLVDGTSGQSISQFGNWSDW
jgi:hypothetical protein